MFISWIFSYLKFKRLYFVRNIGGEFLQAGSLGAIIGDTWHSNKMAQRAGQAIDAA